MNNVVKFTHQFKITFFVIVLLTSVNSFGQNTNLENLLSSQQWDELFPRRAGTYGVHPQGYTNENSAGTYSQASTEFPPNPAVGYYGRGPIQLSWNYNYGQLSKFLYNDVNFFKRKNDTK
ncbi:MAG: hypothetical protein RL204_751 [Bacteroidota bacterium]|jgi:hypothetical protein